jgi:hypothetical protein
MSDELHETVAILRAYLIEHGVSASDLSCSDSGIALNYSPEGQKWKWKILEIFVDGTKLTCKSEVKAPMIGGSPAVGLDLHSPDSLYELLGIVQDIQEEASKTSPMEDLAQKMVFNKMLGKLFGGGGSNI